MRTGGTWLRAAIALATVVGLAGLGGPAAAATEEQAHCTVLVGTHADLGFEEPVRASATSPAGGIGECELTTLDEDATITEESSAEGCQVYADTDRDAFVETAADEGESYEAGTALVAFCQAGVTMADNAVTLSA